MEGSRVKENDELIQALQIRVSQLEAQARRWRALSVLVVLAGVLLVYVRGLVVRKLLTPPSFVQGR
jgi:hypothetical protein